MANEKKTNVLFNIAFLLFVDLKSEVTYHNIGVQRRQNCYFTFYEIDYCFNGFGTVLKAVLKFSLYFSLAFVDEHYILDNDKTQCRHTKLI